MEHDINCIIAIYLSNELHSTSFVDFLGTIQSKAQHFRDGQCSRPKVHLCQFAIRVVTIHFSMVYARKARFIYLYLPASYKINNSFYHCKAYSLGNIGLFLQYSQCASLTEKVFSKHFFPSKINVRLCFSCENFILKHCENHFPGWNDPQNGIILLILEVLAFNDSKTRL